MLLAWCMSYNFCHNWPTTLYLVVTESSSRKYSILKQNKDKCDKNSVELVAKYLEDAITFIHTRELLSIHYLLSNPSFNNPWHIIDTNRNNANAINREAEKSVTNLSADLISSVEKCKLLASAKVIQVNVCATVDWNPQPQVYNVFIIILAPKTITGVCSYACLSMSNTHCDNTWDKQSDIISHVSDIFEVIR